MNRVVLGALAVAALAAGTPARADEPDPAGARQLTVTRTAQVTPRLTEYGLTTPALASETNLRVLLPGGYADHPQRRYPVLYLLHGCCDFDVNGSQAWTTHGEVEATTKGLDLIVVMPDSGKGGFYTDWVSGLPHWETYHLGQLMPWVDQTFRTIPHREGRIIAGLSMGGFGALSYAAQHPDRFLAAASFSGLADTNVNDPAGPFAVEALSGLDGGTPGSVFGLRATDEVVWRGHNPWDLAANLRGMPVELRTGNGLPGGDLKTSGDNAPDPIELTVHQATLNMDAKLTSLRIDHLLEDYGPGSHSWPYWARDLQKTLPTFMKYLADPPARPARTTYTTIEPDYAIDGWHVVLDRPAKEFSTLRDADAHGFRLSGSGRATVTTPPFFDPRRPIRTSSGTIGADGRGRLIFSVDLGPGNARQQYAPGATSTFHTATVTIDPGAPQAKHRKARKARRARLKGSAR